MICYNDLTWQQQTLLDNIQIRSVDNEVNIYQESHELTAGFRLVRRRLTTQTPLYYPASNHVNYIGVCFTFTDKHIDPKYLAYSHLHHQDMNITNGYYFMGNTLQAINCPVYYVSLQFSADYIHHLNEHQPLPKWLLTLIKHQHEQIIDRLPVPTNLRQLAWQLCCLPKTNRLSDSLKIQAKAMDWLAMMLEMTDSNSIPNQPSFPYPSTDKQRQAQKACDIIHREFIQPLTIAELAARVATNECYLKYYFKQLTGLSVHDYLTQYRLEQACYMLQYRPELNIQNIAGLCGYPQASYFSQLFKKKYGVTPSQYRKTIMMS